MICILAQRGRFLETILKDGARSGVPRCGANAPREVRTPTAGHFVPWRGQSLRLRSHCREPASWVRIRKPPRWSAERGPGRPGTGWSRVAGATERMSAPVGAPSTPHRGDGIAAVATAAGVKAPWARRRTRKRRHMRRDGQTRTQQRAAGTNNTALFDIVNAATGNGSLRAPRLRTRRARTPLSCPGRASVRERRPGT